MENNKTYLTVDNFIDDETCDMLISYFNDTIKHTKLTNANPTYDNRIVYYENVKNPTIKNVIKQIHDTTCALISDFYKLDKQIYPESSHIVIWKEGHELGAHADAFYEDGSPNYTFWRTHSAVLYLNDEYIGGEFYFKDELPAMIKPKKGMLIFFTSGMDHIHGVNKVETGNRYTLPMWFSDDTSKINPVYLS